MHDLATLVLRLTFGGLMLFNHGLGKVERYLDGGGFADPLGIGERTSLLLAAGAESLAAGLIAAGLATRVACLPMAFTMGVAAFVVHADDPWSKKEMALLYLGATVAIFLLGSGRWALQRALPVPKARWLRFWMQ